MTCIVGMAQKDKVWVGGDSAASSSDTMEKCLRRDPKVFKNGEFLIGYSGSFRFGQILRYKFIPPGKKDDQEDYEYMVTDWLDALRHACKEGGFSKIEDNEEELPDASALIGYHNKLYVLDSDFQIGELTNDMYAIGCGAGLALGSMATSMKISKRMPPRKRIQLALEASAQYALGVEPPFLILSI
jgi:ATP-dependent protease HslVU (ClpYQ) peptidase subunit